MNNKILQPGTYPMFQNSYQVSPAPANVPLSRGELRILSLIATGKSLVQMADILLLKPSLIKMYEEGMQEKLNLKSNKELEQYAIKINGRLIF
jgi:DNA-binding CsgD family transcriptional regulator